MRLKHVCYESALSHFRAASEFSAVFIPKIGCWAGGLTIFSVSYSSLSRDRLLFVGFRFSGHDAEPPQWGLSMVIETIIRPRTIPPP